MLETILVRMGERFPNHRGFFSNLIYKKDYIQEIIDQYNGHEPKLLALEVAMRCSHIMSDRGNKIDKDMTKPLGDQSQLWKFGPFSFYAVNYQGVVVTKKVKAHEFRFIELDIVIRLDKTWEYLRCDPDDFTLLCLAM